MSRELDAAEARGQRMLRAELYRLKVLHVIQGRYWMPDKEAWMGDYKGRTFAEIIERVELCGVWLGGPSE